MEMRTRDGYNERQGIRFIQFLQGRLLVGLCLAVLILGSLRSIDVIRVHLFVLLFSILCHLLPFLTLFGRQTLPHLTDGLGEIGLSGFLDGTLCFGSVLFCLAIFTALAAKEDERVLGTLDVVLVALLRPALDGVATAR